MQHQLSIQDFNQKVTLPAVKLKAAQIQTFTKAYKDKLRHSHNLPKVYALSKDQKLIPVIPDLKQQDIQVTNPTAQLIQYEFSLTIENFTPEQIFNHYVPKVTYPHSFQTVGHIAHYNLTQEQVPYGKLIGQILLYKLKIIKTVVNKIEKLHNQYRTPILELLAGEKVYQVEVREQGVRFQLNFEKVYWCSRLSTERDRVMKLFEKDETLLDLFCGVGPLAVRAAKSGLNVIANDLNPDCHFYLTKNAQINKVSDRMLCFNDCARKVARKWYDSQYVSTLDGKFKKFHHVYMNLPVDAIEFLDVFQNFLAKSKWKPQQLPMMHVNGFVVGIEDQECKQKMGERIGKVLPGFKPQDITVFGYIKNVTNVMRMYCVSFRLPAGGDIEEDKWVQEPKGVKIKKDD